LEPDAPRLADLEQALAHAQAGRSEREEEGHDAD
jgi:hypothetical protein